METETLKTPTPADFKRPEVVNAAVDYIAHKAAADLMRQRVDEIGQRLLDTTHPLTDDNGQRVAEVRWSWRAYSGEGWQAWQSACVDEQRKAGLRPAGWKDELCPALVAEVEMRDACRRLVEISGKPFGVTHAKLIGSPDGMRNLERWVELALGLALSKGGRR